MGRQDDTDFRWIRTGWFDQERPVDALVKHLRELWPEVERMPRRWSAANQIDFIQKYGHGLRLADTASYQMFLVNGIPVFRLWHNAKTKALLECNNHVARFLLDEGFKFEPIPPGSKRRRREFDLRTTVKLPEELTLVSVIVRDLYGLGDA